ncbi:MAG: hypothetical protein ACXVB0_23080 [Mucilaginibacter sp.]
MKIIVISLMVLLSAKCLIAQSNKGMILPTLKESPKVDSLFDVIIRQCKSQSIYFSLSVDDGVPCMFSTIQLKYDHTGIYFPFMKRQYMKNFGFFKHKGYVIFVSGGIDPLHFFIKSNDKKSFDFVWHGPEIYDDSNDLYTGFFEYKDGTFSLWNFHIDSKPIMKAKPKDSL